MKIGTSNCYSNVMMPGNNKTSGEFSSILNDKLLKSDLTTKSERDEYRKNDKILESVYCEYNSNLDSNFSDIELVAKKYIKGYPNIVKSMDEAIMYAELEIAGLSKRTDGGIMMLGSDSISFQNKNGEDVWLLIFDENEYENIKEDWEVQEKSLQCEDIEFWKEYFDKNEIVYEEYAADGRSEENRQGSSETISQVIVKPDGSRVLLLTIKSTDMETTMSLEISKPTEMTNHIQKDNPEQTENATPENLAADSVAGSGI